MIELRGTSHIAGEDLESIGREVQDKQPDVVAIELDRVRLKALMNDKQGRRPGNPFFLFLKYIQELLGRRTGVAPGSDMLEAFRAAEKEGIDVALIDQNIAFTLQKLKDAPVREKIKFVGYILVAPLIMPGMNIDLENVPGEELVEDMLLRFEVGFPEMYNVLVKERNQIMAERLISLEKEYDEVLAFVGAGHVQGLEDILHRA
ncbi:MAG: TraB/GumN family protein [Candidatus Nanohaloarchaeota archaeon QJJ-7]|nr:TraB/GumN family protein [Candidatus Nanohaloarchaeota archaeon QJJ-7]